MSRRLSCEAYVEGLLARDPAMLARAITLIESRLPDDRALAADVLAAVLPRSGQALRLGITGVPGVGKSTFIDALGTLLTGRGHRVAVLAVDPSSTRTGGSILGDKTRMARLAADPAAFVRPSPTAGTLGGVARTTRETMHLCEAAGFDIVLVETVGVGQSETAVAEMVDTFLVLALPGAGDDLQGIKKGVLERADLIAVNKADGDNALRARQAAEHYRRALHILEPQDANWTVPVLLMSALEGQGLDTLWREVERHREVMQASGGFEAKRRGQRLHWFQAQLEARLMDLLLTHDEAARALGEVRREVVDGALDPRLGVDQVLKALRRDLVGR